jgi:hypothetical protein
MKPLAATALFCVLLAAPPTQAAYDPIGSGQAKLSLDPSFASLLKRDRVKLTAAAGATKHGSSFTLAVPAGNFDPTTGEGEMGGSQLKLATSKKLSFAREGFESTFGARQLRFTAKLATRLDKKLRPKVPFEEGQLLGAVKATTEPLTTAMLEQGRATLLFDPGFVAKLNSLFVSMNPIFPAEHQGSTFSFPIVVGGALAPDASQGTLRTGGEVELLQLGGGQVFWHELWLDLGARVDSAEENVQPSPPYAGKTGRIGLFDASTAAAQISSNPAARTISARACR